MFFVAVLGQTFLKNAARLRVYKQQYAVVVVVHVGKPAVYCTMLLLYHGAEIGFDIEDGLETAVATGSGLLLIFNAAKGCCSAGRCDLPTTSLSETDACCYSTNRRGEPFRKAKRHARYGCAAYVRGVFVDSSARGRWQGHEHKQSCF